jgi:hypothetical protein
MILFHKSWLIKAEIKGQTKQNLNFISKFDIYIQMLDKQSWVE